MKIIEFRIENFKSFSDLTIHLDKKINVFTGVNNSGKTTVLEAISLWSECFRKLITQARKAVKNYVSGDFIFGPSSNKYFDFSEINSVRSPFFEDLFKNRDKKNKIKLTATLENNYNDTIVICFKISDSVGKYIIEIEDHNNFNYLKFNTFFKHLPNAIVTYYVSPVATIEQYEEFTTDPVVYDSINLRKSSSKIRNRLYRLSKTQLFTQFQNDLSYIILNQENILRLHGNNYGITFHPKSDISKDSRVLINYTIGNNNLEKDIALLGSGTLQTIEILLNLYQDTSDSPDLNIILLDEPDSHIHRDIQKRLMKILSKYSNKNQIFITTHSESLIRNTDLCNLFHIENNITGIIKNLYSGNLTKVNIPHFKGMYPSELTPIIKSIGEDTGLDFINAIEAEKIIFVEGDDDARIIYKLLQVNPSNKSRKFMFWVLGGVSKIFDKINTYQTFFSEIKNGKTLWQKSFLVFDKDCMTDAHINIISEKLKTNLKIDNYVFSSYTQESVLFTDLEKLSRLLQKFIITKFGRNEIDSSEILSKLTIEYSSIKSSIEARYSDTNVTSTYKQYLGSYVEKTKSMFKLSSPLIQSDPVFLCEELKNYYKKVIEDEKLYKLMNKDDTEIVINKTLQNFNISFTNESDFYDLICCVDNSTFYNDWNFLNTL